MQKFSHWFGCLFLAACVSGVVQAAPKADLWDFWDVADDTQTLEIDHRLWQETLDDFLVLRDGLALFDYKTAEKQGRDRVSRYIEAMKSLDPREFSRDVQMAYWINLYNALTVNLILDNYPVSSITKLGKGWFRFGPWDDPIVSVAGQTLTLNDIEHRILRPIWQDERIHFAVNCASVGCPNLGGAFTAKNIEIMLDEGASVFLEHPRGVSFDAEGRLNLSSLFEWYGEDFGDSESEVLSSLASYASDDLAEKLRAYEGKIRYEYDWQLNDIDAAVDE